MKQGTIVSAIIGGAFFGLTFLGLKLSFIPAIAIGIVGFVAGELFFSNDKKDFVLEDLPDNVVIGEMKKINQNIYTMIAKVDNVDLKSDIKNIYQTTNKIIEKVSKDKNSLKKIRTFINYYLPVTLKILEKYDEIENQHMNTKDGKEFMKTVEEKIKVISKAFENQHGALYQNDMVDVDAELGVLENMLKTEGYTDIEDFNLRERGKGNE